MKIQINRKLLPVKAHFFFFFAALGPILPQLNVYGRQLGVSAEVMGYVTAGLPLLWAAAKPAFGYVVDYWPNHRKLVFMFLIIVMTGSYSGLWFIPTPVISPDTSNNSISSLEYTQHVYKMNDTVYLQNYNKTDAEFVEKFKCHWSCAPAHNFEVYLANTTYINTIYADTSQNISCDAYEMDFNDCRDGIGVTCTPKADCNLLCFEDEDLADASSNRTKRNHNKIYSNNNATIDSIFKPEDVSKYKKVVDLKEERKSEDKLTNESKNNLQNQTTNDNGISTAHTAKSIDISKEPLGHHDILAKISKVVHIMPEEEAGGSFYVTAAFWSFVILMCVGTVAFNVANCIGDAVCFDVLGPENGSQYGAQRAWGTAGYGVTALLGGWLVDMVSTGSAAKDFTPAFLLALVATAVDLFSCRRLKLPSLSSPDDSGKALREVLKIPRVVVFICFAVVAGVFDSFIIYYMFWFLEDIAEQTGHQGKIKLIEGIIVAGQSFIGEIVFFALSGRIIKRWGYGTTLTLSLFCYGIRMALISLIQNPWHLIPIESIMQGPTYALCYSTIVGYAAHVAPEGYSATVQGIVAGMDDGVGFALGSLVGGQLYGWAGGRASFRILAVTAGIGSLLHAVLFALVTRKKPPPSLEPPEEGEKMLPISSETRSSAIYHDTVVSVTEKEDR
ncbi:hypothetical protein O0L34_g8056 [Tuta absoluta]|nr:hypothetical protein O0L34_g8056 [Tuta absoluta]